MDHLGMQNFLFSSFIFFIFLYLLKELFDIVYNF